MRSAGKYTLLVVAGVALSGCTVHNGTVAAPATSTSPTPTATDGSEQLVMPIDDILEWSQTVVPTTDDEGFAGAFSGWMSQQSSPRHSTSDQSAQAGAYRLTMVCEGESSLAVTVETLDGAVLAESAADCATSTTTSIDFVTPSEGFTTTLSLEGAPVVYAVAFQDEL
jgi:hypothetical protein